MKDLLTVIGQANHYFQKVYFLFNKATLFLKSYINDT